MNTTMKPGVLDVIDELIDFEEGHAEYERRANYFAREARTAIEGLANALDDLSATADIAPERNCSCFISSPCTDCIEWDGLRESLATARAALAAYRGEL